MRQTGIEWMPDIPAHWKMRRLKTLVQNITEHTNALCDGDAYVSLEHVKSWTGEVQFPDDKIAFDSQVKRFKAGDILFGKLRPYLAKVARLKQQGVCVGEFLVLRITTNEIIGSYLEQKLRSKEVITLVNTSTFGAKMPRAEWGFIGNVLIGFPPNQNEQEAVIRSIAADTRTLSEAIIRTERGIRLMHEFRTGLIADVVTGKLDVRAAAAALPEITENEPIDEPAGGEDLDEAIDDADFEEAAA